MRVKTFVQHAAIVGTLASPALAATDSRLIDAIKDQNGQAVASLLRSNPDVNAAQPDGATPLAWAAYLDQPDAVAALLKAGAKVNTADEYGETPLTLACGTGDTKVIESLLAAGADAKATRWDGETALMIAARAGTLEGVKLLLAKGAPIDALEPRHGQNALMWAAAEGHADVVDFLIKSGADVKVASKGGFNALVFAVQKGDARTVSELIQAGLSPNYAVRGQSVLLIAVAGAKTKAADLLLDSGADPKAADNTGNAPLLIASLAGNLDLVKMLLQKGADPNVRTAPAPAAPAGAGGGGGRFAAPGQLSSLFFAAQGHHVDVMRALVAAGADPKLRPEDGSTLLMAAASSGHVESVKYAFELDPDIKAVSTRRKSTALHYALTGTSGKATQDQICEVVQFLADNGADLDATDGRGQTAIAIGNVIPIDKATFLIGRLIEAKGGTPKVPPKK
jgi:uncharacterized protein